MYAPPCLEDTKEPSYGILARKIVRSTSKYGDTCIAKHGTYIREVKDIIMHS